MMNQAGWRRVWPVVKWLLALLIIGAVGWVFYKNLKELERHDVDWEPAWLGLAVVLYITGFSFSAFYWWWAMRVLGQRPGLPWAFRAYYIGHLGKYVPGKAFVILMRAWLVQGPEVRAGVAGLTVAYEGLVSMAAGAFLAALLIAFRVHSEVVELWHALVLFGLATLIILPPVFNKAVGRLTAPFRQADAAPLPHLDHVTFIGGLLLGGISWFFLGGCLWAVVAAVHEYPLTFDAILDCTAYLCLAVVAGFFNPAPGGLGVREWVLMVLFTPTLGPALASFVAVLLRLTWISTEVALAAVLYPAPLIWSKVTVRS